MSRSAAVRYAICSVRSRSASARATPEPTSTAWFSASSAAWAERTYRVRLATDGSSWYWRGWISSTLSALRGLPQNLWGEKGWGFAAVVAGGFSGGPPGDGPTPHTHAPPA